MAANRLPCWFVDISNNRPGNGLRTVVFKGQISQRLPHDGYVSAGTTENRTVAEASREIWLFGSYKIILSHILAFILTGSRRLMENWQGKVSQLSLTATMSFNGEIKFR